MAVDFYRNVYCVLGLPFDAMEMMGAVGRIKNAAALGIRCFISTPNVNWVVGCRSDSAFRISVLNSDLSLADGMPLIWVARLLGLPLQSRIAGSDLFDSLKLDLGEPMSVYFFGGEKGVAEAACRGLNDERSGLVCAGFSDPGFGPVEEMSDDATIATINRSGADFLIVSLGARKGQAWIERNRARLTAPLICHLGAVVNYAAGVLGRAPTWMRRTGLEWFWRVAVEPRLWRRYFADGSVFIAMLVTRVLPYAWYMAWHRPNKAMLAAARVDMRDDGQALVLRLAGAWTQHNMGPLRDIFTIAARKERDVNLEMEGITYLDSSMLGLLLILHGHQMAAGKAFSIRSPSRAVRTVIGYSCAEYLC